MYGGLPSASTGAEGSSEHLAARPLRARCPESCLSLQHKKQGYPLLSSSQCLPPPLIPLPRDDQKRNPALAPRHRAALQGAQGASPASDEPKLTDGLHRHRPALPVAFPAKQPMPERYEPKPALLYALKSEDQHRPERHTSAAPSRSSVLPIAGALPPPG